MRKVLVCLMAVSLTACGIPMQFGSVPVAPSAIADKTTVDESAMIGVRTLYEAWLTLVEIATDGHVITASNAQAVLDLDERIHRIYLVAVRAYKFGNAEDFDTAKTELKALVLQGKAAIVGNKL